MRGSDIQATEGICPWETNTKMQTMQHCTGHWNPFAGRRPALGTGVPAEGRHWPALGARRSAVLPAEGRRWLGRRPALRRAQCARGAVSSALCTARGSAVCEPYIYYYIFIYCYNIYKYTYYTAVYIYYEY